MTYMDIMPPKDIHELTLSELVRHYSDDYKRRNNITIGKRILVKSEATCWTCRRPFLAEPYQCYCSESCLNIGEWNEDNWRND